MIGIPSVDALPPVPSRSDDRETFAAKADAFLSALPIFISQLNALASALPDIVSAVNYNTTSTSSLAIATGSKTFAIATGGLFQIGQWVVAASAAAPSNYMAGQVTSHNSTTGQLIVDVQSTGGSGTKTDWVISLSVPEQLSAVKNIAITGSGADLTASSVTYDRLQNTAAASVLIGRGGSSGAGVVHEITLGSGLTMTGAVLAVSGGTATLANGNYGDVTAASSGTSITINAAAVTYAKMQNVSGTDKLLGRASAGAGVVEEITCTAFGRSLIDDANAATARATLGCGTIAVMDEATAANLWANVADKALSTDAVWAAAASVTLTDATTIAVDLNTGLNFKVTLGGNRTLGAPTNGKDKQTGVIEIKQDGTGNRTLSFNAAWKFAGGSAPVLSTAAGARDLLYYQVLNDGTVYASLVKNV